VREHFGNANGYYSFLAATFVAVFVIFACTYALGRKFSLPREQSLFATAMLAFVLVAILSIYYLFDYFYWSSRYPYTSTPSWWQLDIADHELGYEKLRAGLFGSAPWLGPDRSVRRTRPEGLTRFLGLDVPVAGSETSLSVSRNVAGQQRIDVIKSDHDAVVAYLEDVSLADVPRILFLGTSQTWGSGANRGSERIAPTVQRLLAERFDLHAAVINGAKRGSRSGELLARHRDHLSLFKPTMVVVNLSHNDSNLADFERNLQGIVDLNRELGATTIFVQEAITPERNDSRLRKKHAVLDRVAAHSAIRIIDLHGFLRGPDIYDSGIFYWDPIHLTSYGQTRAAAFISEHIAEEMRKSR